MSIHIGKIIEEKLREQERGATWLAGKLSCNRSNVYKIFEKESIDTGLLQRISKILDYNFFEEYCRKKP